MSHTIDLVRGLLQLLDDAGVGRYRPAAEPGQPWTEDDVALVAKDLPASPDRAVAIHPYRLPVDARLSEGLDGLQITVRGRRGWDDDEDIADAVFDELHGLRNTRLSTGVWVELVTFQSGAPGGLDDNDRWQLVTNYYARTHRPSTHRT